MLKTELWQSEILVTGHRIMMILILWPTIKYIKAESKALRINNLTLGITGKRVVRRGKLAELPMVLTLKPLQKFSQQPLEDQI
jgi:hypothetical protein